VAGQRIGHVRVSTLDQNEKRQLEGQVLDRVFTDKASGRDTSRPELAELLQFARLIFTGEDSPMANLMLSVMGAFAEFERSLIRERQREGIALAKQRGAYKGRKKTLTPERAAELVQRAARMESPNPSSPATMASAGKRCTSTSAKPSRSKPSLPTQPLTPRKPHQLDGIAIIGVMSRTGVEVAARTPDSGRIPRFRSSEAL
jgi:DNA invertase Pin-like site-specific DNA recombinase